MKGLQNLFLANVCLVQATRELPILDCISALSKTPDHELIYQALIKKNLDEISATVKSIQTNFTILVLGIISSILTKQLPVEYQIVFNGAATSIQGSNL